MELFGAVIRWSFEPRGAGAGRGFKEKVSFLWERLSLDLNAGLSGVLVVKGAELVLGQGF